MALFPTSPANGQTANVDGIQYTYSSSQTAWVRSGTFVGNAIANTVTASGNITANFFIGNGSQLTGITATTANTVTDNAQPNITSVGTLTGLVMEGNITPNTSNTYTLGNATNRWTDLYLSGNTIFLGNANIQANATAVIITNPDGGQFVISGNGTASSNTIYNGTSNVSIPTANGNINLSAAGNANVVVVTGTSVNVSGTLNATGNANVGNIGATNGVFTNLSGNGSSLSSITGANVIGAVAFATTANAVAGANVSGTVSSATTAGTVTTAAQPNITSVGTLTGLSVNGNITAANITANTGVFTGNGAGLSQLAGANVTGTVANATFATSAGSATTAGTVTTAAQPNITSVGNLTALTVTGNTFLATTSGNVGVGVSSASTKMDVDGGEVRIGEQTAGNGAWLNVNLRDGTTASAAIRVSERSSASSSESIPVTQPHLLLNRGSDSLGSFIKFTNARDGYSGIGSLATVANGHDIRLYTGTGTEKLRVDANGNVGIGNTSPTHALSVTGTTNISGNLSAGNISTSGVLSVTGNASAGNISATAGTFTSVSGNGSALTALNASNISTGTLAQARLANSNVILGNTTLALGTTTTTIAGLSSVTSTTFVGALTGAATTAGTVTTAAQPNITSVGTLTSLGVNGTVTAVAFTANTGVFTGNGSALTALNASNVSSGTLAQARLANSNVILGNTTLALGTTTTTIAGLSSVTSTTFVGALTGAATTAGTVTTAAQPNITSVGTLTSLGVNGTVTAVAFTANTGVFTGNGSALTALNGSNITTGTIAAARVATLNQNTTGSAATVTTAAQPNITSVGTLTNLSVSGNTVIGGNLTVNGNLVYVNVDTLAVSDPIIELQTGANGAAPTANSGKDVGTALNYFDTAARVAFMGWDVSNAEFGLASVASISGEVVTFTTYGNLRVGNIIGNGQALTGLNGSNITTGTVAAARVATLNQNTTGSAATVTTAAQPNITSVGTLTSLGVSGTITAANITANTGVFTGNGSALTALNGSNITTGTIAAARVATLNQNTTGSAATVTTAAQPNITSVGTLTSLGVNGTVTAVAFTANTGVFTGNGSALTALNGSNITTGTVAAARVATLNQNTTGSAATVTTAAQPNITSVGTLTGLGVNGTITGVNITANTGVFTGNGSALTALNGSNITTGTVAAARVATLNQNTTGSAATVTTAAQPNITSVGTLTGLGVNGTITGVNITANTGVFTGNGSALTALNGSNITTGTIAAARVATLNQNTTGSAATVTTAAQPNITSVGTLTALTVSGNVSIADRIIHTGDTDTAIRFPANDTVTVETAGSERLRVTSTGLVGIGTTTPSTRLDVNGDITVKSNIAYVAPNGANTINSTMLNGGTLAWSGNAGQLFSITDSMTGNIFTVNDVSGIPMISVDAGGNIQFAASGGFVNYGVTAGITAAGSTQGTATALTRPINVVSTVSASTGVILPTVPPGARVIVMNTSGTALNVYPPSGAAINSAATNAAYAQPAGARLEFISVSATQWYTMNATYG